MKIITHLSTVVSLTALLAACASTNTATRGYHDGDVIQFGFDWSKKTYEVLEKSDGMIPVPHHDEVLYAVSLNGASGAQQVDISTDAGPFASFWLTPTGAFSEGIAAAGADEATAAKRARQMWTAWVDLFIGRSFPLGTQTILNEDGFSRKYSVAKNESGNIVAVMEQTAMGNETIVVVSSEYLDPEKGTLLSVHRQMVRLLDGKRKVIDEQLYTFR